MLSVAWAADRAAALTEASRTVFLLLLFTVALAVVRTPRSRTIFLTALVLGTAGLGLLVTFKLGTLARPADLFDEFKMMYPLGYANATGAFFALPALLGLYLASEPDGPVWRRSLLFAATVLLLEMTTLSQSRGAFWALFGAAAVYLALTPRRVRALLWGGAVVAVLAVGFQALNVLHLDALRRDMDAFAAHTPAAVRALVRLVGPGLGRRRRAGGAGPVRPARTAGLPRGQGRHVRPRVRRAGADRRPVPFAPTPRLHGRSGMVAVHARRPTRRRRRPPRSTSSPSRGAGGR